MGRATGLVLYMGTFTSAAIEWVIQGLGCSGYASWSGEIELYSPVDRAMILFPCLAGATEKIPRPEKLAGWGPESGRTMH